jgi:hypothetical protein
MFSRAHPELSALLCVTLIFCARGAVAQDATATGEEAPGAVAPATEVAPESAEHTPEATPEATPEESDQQSEQTADATGQTAPTAETTPAPEARPATYFPATKDTAGRRVDSDEEPEQATSCGSGSIALSSGGCTKPWRLIGYAEYRQLAVTDDDPAAGRSMRMFVQGSYRVAKKHNVSVWGRVRYLQNFVAEEGESAARFQDPILGVDYSQQLSTDAGNPDAASFFLQHRISGTIPAQRETRATDLTTRLSSLERARFIPIPSVYIGPDLTTGYNVYRYAEQPGQQGTVNEQADFTGTMVVEWYPLQDERWGSILLGADAGVGYTVNYKGRGGELAQEENRWGQSYAWDLYGYYMPVPQLWLGAAVSHGMGLLRDGVAMVDFANRDATLLSFNCVALY